MRCIAEDMDYHSVDESDGNDDHLRTASVSNRKAASSKGIQDLHANKLAEPIRLENGNWACNHRCKDKTRYVATNIPCPCKPY